MQISNGLQPFITNEKQQELVEAALQLAQQFEESAKRHDADNSFPFEHFEQLKEAGFHALTIPKAFGGKEISLYDLMLVQETLALGCASTALGLGWHLGILMNIRETKAWHAQRFEQISRSIVEEGKWLNSLSTEPSTGSPSRGRRHHTTARQTADGGWVVSGHKTWATLSPLIDYMLISAAIEGENKLGEFLVQRDLPGVELKETWDSVGMRATGSHDVILSDVRLPASALLESHEYGQPSIKGSDANGWLLHIPACYLGVGAAARSFAVDFAKHYQPAGAEHPIAEFPNVKDKLGKMEMKLYNSRCQLYHIAAHWDQSAGQRAELRPLLSAAKYEVTNHAVDIVDLAMRVVGGRSMLKDYPLERYYRDVRGGLHNPPMDDVVVQMMAKHALADFD